MSLLEERILDKKSDTSNTVGVGEGPEFISKELDFCGFAGILRDRQPDRADADGHARCSFQVMRGVTSGS